MTVATDKEFGGLDALADDGDTGGQVLSLALWGVGAALAVGVGVASWQYAPPHGTASEQAQIEAVVPRHDEITGSIGDTRRATANDQVVAADIVPQPLGADEHLATSRDIERLRADIDDLRRRLAETGTAGLDLGRRLDRIEQRLDTLPNAPRSEAPAAPGTPTAAIAPPPEEFAALVAAAPPEAMSTADAAAPAEMQAPQTTGAIDKPSSTIAVAPVFVAPPLPKPSPRGARAVEPAPTPAPAAQPPATDAAKPATAARLDTPPLPPPGPAETAALDLGGYRSLSILKRAWSELALRHGDLGHGMQPLARLRETDGSVEARLLAGPFVNQTEAAKACMRLKAAGVGCAVTTYIGQSLAGLR